MMEGPLPKRPCWSISIAPPGHTWFFRPPPRLSRRGGGGRLFFDCPAIKKQPLIPYGTRAVTPAIPPKLTLARPLASRAITRARWITGGSPSASTWPQPFKPPSTVQSSGRAPPRFHRPGLSSGLLCRLLLFLKGLPVCGCWGHYSRPAASCQALFFIPPGGGVR